jgi:predicted MFS family arabinose efflux permease
MMGAVLATLVSVTTAKVLATAMSWRAIYGKLTITKVAVQSAANLRERPKRRERRSGRDVAA